MPIKIQTLVPEKKFHIKVTGQLSVGEIAVELEILGKDLSKFKNQVDVLWDFSEADVPNLSFETIERLADLILNSKRLNQLSGKSVYLIDERAEKYLLSFLINRLQSMGYKRDVQLLHDVKKAYEFLEFPMTELA